MKKILIIQTAFIGDLILATGIIEKIKKHLPEAQTDMLLRDGNQDLVIHNPNIKNLYVWDKKNNKIANLIKILKEVQKQRYDYLINLQRFTSTGFFTWRSKAKIKSGFKKNPFSFCYDIKAEHKISKGIHEIDRNQATIEFLTDSSPEKPKIYLSDGSIKKTERYKKDKYVCIAPSSVWFTKQYPPEKWLELIDALSKKDVKIYLLGSKQDIEFCEDLKIRSHNKRVENLAGELSLLDSASLIKDARMNYVNDSAPLHMASAMNAPVCAVYCSTVPDFGFYPLSDNSRVIETDEKLNCRPCGLHGKNKCPEKHFKCATEIKTERLLFDF